MSGPGGPIVLFDGECNLCSAWVRFVLAHERTHELRFASLQSPFGRGLMEEHGLDPDQIDSIVLAAEQTVAVRSDAVLAILARLRAPYRWIRFTRVVPRPIRDWFYDRVAASRYRLFGRRDVCALPDATMRSRFSYSETPPE